MNLDVDKFVKKAKAWQDEIETLRGIMLETGLGEDLKWGKPCYTHNGKNIAIIQPFKACLGMMLFQGASLKDPKGLLVDNGPNSNYAKRFEFTSTGDITKKKAAIKAYVKEAVALEAEGKKAKPRTPAVLELPEELEEIFRTKMKFKRAFEALTPGRQRSWVLHFSSAKQTATRTARIEKSIEKILAGKGWNERA